MPPTKPNNHTHPHGRTRARTHPYILTRLLAFLSPPLEFTQEILYDNTEIEDLLRKDVEDVRAGRRISVFAINEGEYPYGDIDDVPKEIVVMMHSELDLEDGIGLEAAAAEKGAKN